MSFINDLHQMVVDKIEWYAVNEGRIYEGLEYENVSYRSPLLWVNAL